ncbi:Peroxidasin-like [Papilio machaon]|uniref:Hemolin n=1 Tax=Papilio machaon TaxID=76193 RepID=A0A0N1PKG1_PAPMA|nr:Peroxidasin-like [Papilio machaon]
MSLGSTLNPNDIKEGDDVYFECNIRANPKEHRISWYHNDQQVTQNMSSGVFISTKSLVLQRVMRRDAGLYTCRAANQIGEASSQAVYLRVQLSTGGTASELRYRAASERDYGSLLCRATNAVGRQKKPCVFQIVPAGNL